MNKDLSFIIEANSLLKCEHDLLEAEGAVDFSTLTGIVGTAGPAAVSDWFSPTPCIWLCGAWEGTNGCPLRLAGSIPIGIFIWGSQWLLKTLIASSNRSSIRAPCGVDGNEKYSFKSYDDSCLQIENEFEFKSQQHLQYSIQVNNNMNHLWWLFKNKDQKLTVAFSVICSLKILNASSNISGWLVCVFTHNYDHSTFKIKFHDG